MSGEGGALGYRNYTLTPLDLYSLLLWTYILYTLPSPGPPPSRTDTCENITFPQLRLRVVITARKRSLRRLCFYTCLSVILFTWGVVSQYAFVLLEGSGLGGSTGPHPGGKLRSMAWGVSRPTPRGVSRSTPEGSPGPHPRGYRLQQ